jgi:hypothetical protein
MQFSARRQIEAWEHIQRCTRCTRVHRAAFDELYKSSFDPLKDMVRNAPKMGDVDALRRLTLSNAEFMTALIDELRGCAGWPPGWEPEALE